MNFKECRVTRMEIDEAELHQTLSQAALRHLAACATCSEFRDQRTSLRELVADLGPVTAPADFDMRLRARIAAQQNPARGFFFRGFAVTTPVIACAALIVMALVFWFVQHNRNQEPTLAKSAPVNGTVDRPADASPVGVTVNKGSETAAVPVESPHPVPTKGPREREPGIRQARVITNDPGIKSLDLSSRAAEPIRRNDRNPGEVSLSAPLKPMVVSMEDARGMTRKFSLPPVSFGSQRLVDNRVPVSATKTRSW